MSTQPEQLLEDRIEGASSLGEKDGKSGLSMPNPYAAGTPENEAWRTSFNANRPQADPFDTPEGITEAAMQGMKAAMSGVGFTNPFAVGTARRRAWKQAYESTPKGVPQMSKPEGRSEEEQIAGVQRGLFEGPTGEPVPSQLPTEEYKRGELTEEQKENIMRYVGPNAYKLIPEVVKNFGRQPVGINPENGDVMLKVSKDDPYSAMLEEADNKGRQARTDGHPVGSNPYAEPRVNLLPLTHAWDAGWKARDAELKLVEERKAKKNDVDAAREKWSKSVVVGHQFVTHGSIDLSPSVSSVALAVFPQLLAELMTKNPDFPLSSNAAEAAARSRLCAEFFIAEIGRKSN